MTQYDRLTNTPSYILDHRTRGQQDYSQVGRLCRDMAVLAQGQGDGYKMIKQPQNVKRAFLEQQIVQPQFLFLTASHRRLAQTAGG